MMSIKTYKLITLIFLQSWWFFLFTNSELWELPLALGIGSVMGILLAEIVHKN